MYLRTSELPSLLLLGILVLRFFSDEGVGGSYNFPNFHFLSGRYSLGGHFCSFIILL